MTRQRDPSCLLLAALLLVYVVLATWYSLVIPLGEAPDEVPHFTYVRYLAQNGHLPTTTEEHEAFQPPLYYAWGAALTFWIEDEPDAAFAIRANADFDVTDPRAPKNLLLHTADEAWPYRGWALSWHLVRLLSIAFGSATVWAVYQLGRTIFPTRRAIPLTMAALTAFTPQFLFVSAVVNNDNAAIAFSALVLWQVAALLHEPVEPSKGATGQERHGRLWRRGIVLGLLLGLGMLSKANLLALLPIAGLAILFASFRCQGPGVRERTRLAAEYRFRGGVGGLLLTFGLAALLSGWYLIRNWVLHGDPMGWRFLLQVNARREGPLTVGVLAWLFKGIFRSFWLGWIGITFDEALYWLLAAACLVGLAGFVAWSVRRWRTLSNGTRWTLILLGLHAAITLGSLVQWTATVLGTDQGRLIYPVLPTVMLVLVAGWAWWARNRAQNWVMGALITGMLVLAILTPTCIIAPVYAPAPMATRAELAAATPLNVEWNGVRLLGYRLETGQAHPGDRLVLHLYWQGVRPTDRDLMALIQLVDAENHFLMYTDGSPTAGRDTTDRWTPGVALASRHLLPVPPYGQPGTYWLTISLHPFGESTWLPITGADGRPMGDTFRFDTPVQITLP